LNNTVLRFDGEVAMIAGGGGSLGGAYARLLGQRGARVVVNDISDRARTVADEINAAGGEAIAIVANTATDADAIIEQTLKAFGRLDIVINSSGLSEGNLFHLMTIKDWNRVFDSHFTSTLMLARAAWPHLVASGNGRLINTASTSIFGNPYSSSYVVSKAAIYGATRSWSMEGAWQNVRVNVVLPTAISDMTRSIPDPNMVKILENVFPPERVAGLVGLIAHKDNDFNGMAFECGGGRAAAIFLAEAAPVMPADPESPESWLEVKAGLSSREVDWVPANMMEEFLERLVRLGIMTRADFEKAKAQAWEVSSDPT
jgi:NAD(P)-dependent dehydrogenase (short-subunit alcohol dehydrogenase family)